MTDAVLLADVQQFILNRFLAGEDPGPLTPSTPLVTGGMLDSLGFLDLVAFLKQQLGIELEAPIRPHGRLHLAVVLGNRWRTIIDSLRSGLDRLTHSSDRRRARTRLGRGRLPRRILIVCYGNICRSPYAEAYLRRRLQEAGMQDVEVESAGFFGPNRPADKRGSAIARLRGLDLGNHQSRLVQPADAARADLVLAMTRRHRDELVRCFGIPPERVELLGDFDPADPPQREIADPYGQSDEFFQEVFGQIERSIVGFCATLIKLPR